MTNPIPFPDKQRDLMLLVESALSRTGSSATRRAYQRGIARFLAYLADHPQDVSRKAVLGWLASETHAGAGPSTLNQMIAAVRSLCKEAALAGVIHPHQEAAIRAISGIKQRGVRSGNWLTNLEATHLLTLPDLDTIVGRRDRVVLGLLTGAGLRRDEASCACMEQFQRRGKRALLVDIEGKGRRIRTVPLPEWVAEDIRRWVGPAGITEGWILRPVSQSGNVLESQLSAGGVWWIVKQYAARIGKPELAPHDLRRTFAKLALNGGAPIQQIQVTLGHSSALTTEKYLGTALDLDDSACDHTGL